MKQILVCALMFVFIGTAVAQETVKLKSSTIIVVRTQNALSTKMLKAGQDVFLSVATDVVVSGKTLVTAGTPVIATVESAESAGMVGQAGALAIAIQSTTAVDGSTIALTGAMSMKGESKMGTSIAVGVILCPLALLCKGGEGAIPAGAQARALTMGEYDIVVK